MAKKLKKDTAIAKAKSLKTNVTRKFAVGGTGDPIKVSPTIEKPVQPFPEFYNADKETFDAADNSARSYMTDWFSKRATAFPEKHGEAANAMGSYLQNSGQGAYVPAGTEFKGVSGTADSYGFANEPDYRLSLDQSTTTKALSDNPFSFPQSGGKIKGSNAPLNYNTAYYIGEGGKMPTTQLEEQLHLASNYGEHMSSNHTGSFKKAGEYINAEAIGKMGYPGIEGNEEYYGDPQEFYPRLMSARRTFGLDPSKEYTQQEMSGFLDKGYNDLIKGNITEPGQKEHLIEFYQQLGYPTPSAGFTQGASKEEIEKQKQEAAEKFRKSNNEFAMQKNAEDYGLPQTARYGGYQTYKTGGANKKNVAVPPGGFAMGGFEGPGDPKVSLKSKSKSGQGSYVINQTLYDNGSQEGSTRRSLKGFVKGAPKPGTPGAPAKRFESGGENYMKNMLNANSVTGPRTKHVWQDPGQAPYYFNHGGLKNQVVKKFRAAGFETDPPPVAPVTLPVDENYKMRQDYAAAMAALDAQRLSYAKRLEDEQARVKKVRANVVPTARKLDYDDSHLSEEAMNAFYRSTSAKNPTELAAAKKAYPQELRNVLPTGGNYNIADWDEAAGDWKQGKGPDRELYCTPYGCFTYQKAGAKDVPNISGNFGFTGGVEDGTLPFKKVSDKEAEPGDMAIVYGSAPMNYTDQSAGYGIRPHHTTVLSDKNPIVRDEKGNVEGINMFNATNGMRLAYEEQFYPVEDHFGFYRYVGQIPKLEKEGKGFPIREKEIEDAYNARHAAWLAQQPIPEMMAMKEPGQLRTQGMPMVTSQLQKSSFPSFEQPNKKVKKTKIKI